MAQGRGKMFTLSCAAAGLLAMAAAGVVAKDWMQEAWVAWRAGVTHVGPGRFAIIPTAALKEQRVVIGEGELEVLALLRLVSVYTGLPILLEPEDIRLCKRTVRLAAPLGNVTADLAMGILKANRLLVRREWAVDVGELLSIELTDTPNPVPCRG